MKLRNWMKRRKEELFEKIKEELDGIEKEELN